MNNLPNGYSPEFSSGPTKKPPTWSVNKLDLSYLGRSHRSKKAKARINSAIEKMKHLLCLPKDYVLGIVPGSDTGAFELALWNLLGERQVDILVWESFGKYWYDDIIKELKISDYRLFFADYGELPDLSKVNSNNDIVFTYNGTTSGVRIPNTNWISSKREGLVIADATSACFAMKINWKKIDVATFSWQKCLGGEGGHGVIVLSPKAIKRLENFVPDRPIPKVFRISNENNLNSSIFLGETINTPSMLCIEDLHLALDWAENIGGLDALITRSEKNLQCVKDHVKNSPWLKFLSKNSENISSTSICLNLTAKNLYHKTNEYKKVVSAEVSQLLENKKIAYDIKSYRNAPPGFRVWGGPTVNINDLRVFLPLLDQAIDEVNSKFNNIWVKRK